MDTSYVAREELLDVLTIQAKSWDDAEQQVRQHYAGLDRRDYTHDGEDRPVSVTVYLWRGDTHQQIEVGVGC